MSPEAAIAYRTLSPARTLAGASGDALQNRNPDPFPDGALCFVADQRSLYRLAKFSTEAVSSPEVIATVFGAGAPGRWIQMTGDRALAPLSALFWCDAGFVGVSTGSIAAPFRTLQEAISVIPATGGTIAIVPGNYPDSWTVPANTAVNFYAFAGAQGAMGGGVTIAGGSVLDGGGVRLQELRLEGPILLVGSTACFLDNADCAGAATIAQSGPGTSQVRASGNGVEDVALSAVTCAVFFASSVTLDGPVNVTGTIAVITRSNVEDDVAFTGAPGTLFTDEESLSSMRANGTTLTNGTVSTAQPTLEATVATPIFAGAGIDTANVAFPGVAPGDTFAITNLTALPAGVALGQPSCTAADVVTVVFIALAAAASANVDLAITRFIAGP